MIFHIHFAGPAGVFPIVALGTMTYLVGIRRRARECAIAMSVCVLALIFYKYTHFLGFELSGLISDRAQEWYSAHVEPHLSAAPPLGISFFVFEFVHYLYDVRHGAVSIRQPLDFALFVLFWPSLVAGPVKRYREFLPQLTAGSSRVNGTCVVSGLLRISIGLVKKILADNFSAYVAYWSPQFSHIPISQRWFILGIMSFRILLDFSGYSDIAIGFARMMGIGLPENFRWPYVATSVGEFWRRWHISLSTWVRDYVYIPLGGSRVGPIRWIANGLIAFMICGLWHGAGWNFLVWGLYHGVGLAVSSTYDRAGLPGRVLSILLARARPIAWGLTMLFVGVGWLFFFHPLPIALSMLRLLVGGPE